jgi:hypothetical protein
MAEIEGVEFDKPGDSGGDLADPIFAEVQEFQFGELPEGVRKGSEAVAPGAEDLEAGSFGDVRWQFGQAEVIQIEASHVNSRAHGLCGQTTRRRRGSAWRRRSSRE